MKPVTKLLNARDKILFEKALKFYFFSRQQDIRKLNSRLNERLTYAGRVAYSLIITYLREGNMKIEYMDFLNEELKILLSLDSSDLEPLQIKPDEIDEIELSATTSFKVYDEDEDKDLKLTYTSSDGKINLRPIG